MEVWKNLEGKKVYIILKNQRQYSGIVLNIEIAKKRGQVLNIIAIDNKRIEINSCFFAR